MKNWYHFFTYWEW